MPHNHIEKYQKYGYIFLFPLIICMISILYNIDLLLKRKITIDAIIQTIDSKPRYLIINNAKLNNNVISVLDSAFGTDYDNDPHYANMYDLANGSKGMDWWNFPWDLPSSQPKYTISYADMKNILQNVVVKMEKNDTKYVRYSKKLADNIKKLNPTIMNSHGGHLRVIKIIYCVRNFIAVAMKYGLTDDIENLKPAIQHLLLIDKNKLQDDPNPTNPQYGIHSKFKPKNINGIAENRTRDNGLNQLKALMSSL